MEIKISISKDEDKELVVNAFKLAVGSYPTDDSDEKIVTDALTSYIRETVSQYQTTILQEQAQQSAKDLADGMVLEQSV